MKQEETEQGKHQSRTEGTGVTDPKSPIWKPGDVKPSPSGAPAHAKGAWAEHGYNEKDHEDVLRRVNRKPLGGDGKPTVTVDGHVITVVMPNGGIYRLTVGEREEVPVAPVVPKAAEKDLPKGASLPETITAKDIKKLEYSAPAEHLKGIPGEAERKGTANMSATDKR